MIHRLFTKFGLPAVALAAMVLPARATVVDYSTTGVLTCTSCTGSGTSSITFGSLTLTYLPITSGSVNANPMTNASAGEIKITDTSGNPSSINGSFALTIDQTLPSAGSGVLSGSLSGSISTNNSTGLLTFSNTSLDLGGIQYKLTSFAFLTSYVLVPPSSGGVTSLEMNVTSTLPEPSLIGLTAFGFASMGLIAFRRRRRA